MGPQEGMDRMQEEVTKRVEGMAEDERKFAQEKPHAAVAMALGLGWILANGVPPRVARMVLVSAARAVFKSAVAGGGMVALAEKLGGAMEDHGTARSAKGARAAVQ